MHELHGGEQMPVFALCVLSQHTHVVCASSPEKMRLILLASLDPMIHGYSIMHLLSSSHHFSHGRTSRWILLAKPAVTCRNFYTCDFVSQSTLVSQAWWGGVGMLFCFAIIDALSCHDDARRAV